MPRVIFGDKGTKVWAGIRVDNIARLQHLMKSDPTRVDLEAAKLVRTLGRSLEAVGDSPGANHAYWIAIQLETRPQATSRERAPRRPTVPSRKHPARTRARRTPGRAAPRVGS